MDVTERLKLELDKRTELGISKYGHRLIVDDERNNLLDCLEEALDLNQYLMKEVMQLAARLESLDTQLPANV